MNIDDLRPKLINGKRVASTEYRSWQMMKNRCLNIQGQDYKYYGGRGVKLDPKWLTFEGFMEDMGLKPGKLYTIERKDSNGDYCKANCVWATRKEQARNRDYAKTHKGKHTWEWAAELGIKPMTFHHRLWRFHTGQITEAQLYTRSTR